MDGKSIGEQEVITALKKGDDSAFKSIFTKYHLKIYHFSKKMGLSHEDAEGIVQDVFITIWNKKNYINENIPFQPYLYTITKRLTIKRIRRLVLENKYYVEAKNAFQSTNHQTEDDVVYTELMDKAKESIEQLPPERKHIFILSKQEGLSNKEIANKLNISQRTVENQLYRALKTLRKLIENNPLLILVIYLTQ